MNSKKERNNYSPACSPCRSSPARLLVNATELVVEKVLEFPRRVLLGNSLSPGPVSLCRTGCKL